MLLSGNINSMALDSALQDLRFLFVFQDLSFILRDTLLCPQEIASQVMQEVWGREAANTWATCP